jgi:hypothetical protein
MARAEMEFSANLATNISHIFIYVYVTHFQQLKLIYSCIVSNDKVINEQRIGKNMEERLVTIFDVLFRPFLRNYRNTLELQSG